MWRSSSCTRWTRTWKWKKSQYLWRAQTRHRPAAGEHQPSRMLCVPYLPLGAHLVPRPFTSHPCASPLGPPTFVPPSLQGPGRPPQSTGPLARAPGHPPTPPCRREPRGPGACSRGHPHPPLWGSAPATPPPPPSARSVGRGRCLPADRGGQHCHGSPPYAASSGHPSRSPRAEGPEPRPGLGALARRVGRLARPPPAPVPVDGKLPMRTRGQGHSPPPPGTTQHQSRHTTNALGDTTTGAPAATHV